MGRIKPKVVKRTTHALLKYDKEYNVFTCKFEENKEILKYLELTPSKKVRNQIAGYITRLKKKDIQKKI
ncbi:MAG: 30S ribosomal protein S17e [Candidatus Pacearchaeota archaeon]